MSYDDQLNFAIRQQGWIKHVVLPKRYDFRTPFLEANWVDFILSVPQQYRENQYLYKEILQKAYPKLFSIPTKKNRGLKLNTANTWQGQFRTFTIRAGFAFCRFIPCFPWGAHPMTNYIDFNQSIREREDLKTLIYENLQELKQRGIVDWVDIDSIWKRHQHKFANHGDALILLTALEINLKVQEKRINQDENVRKHSLG